MICKKTKEVRDQIIVLIPKTNITLPINIPKPLNREKNTQEKNQENIDKNTPKNTPKNIPKNIPIEKKIGKNIMSDKNECVYSLNKFKPNTPSPPNSWEERLYRRFNLANK